MNLKITSQEEAKLAEFNAFGTLLGIGCKKGIILVMDFLTKEIVRIFDLHACRDAKFNANLRNFIPYSNESYIVYSDVSNTKPAPKYKNKSPSKSKLKKGQKKQIDESSEEMQISGVKKLTAEITNLQWSADSAYLFASYKHDNYIILWDVENSIVMHKIEIYEPGFFNAKNFALNPFIAITSSETPHLINMKTGEMINFFKKKEKTLSPKHEKSFERRRESFKLDAIIGKEEEEEEEAKEESKSDYSGESDDYEKQWLTCFLKQNKTQYFLLLSIDSECKLLKQRDHSSDSLTEQKKENDIRNKETEEDSGNKGQEEKEKETETEKENEAEIENEAEKEKEKEEEDILNECFEEVFSTKFTYTGIAYAATIDANNTHIILNCTDRYLRILHIDYQKPSIQISRELFDVINKKKWMSALFFKVPKYKHPLIVSAIGESGSHEVYFLSKKTGSIVKRLEPGQEGCVNLTCHNHSHNSIVVVTSNGDLLLWSVKNPKGWSALAPGFHEIDQSIPCDDSKTDEEEEEIHGRSAANSKYLPPIDLHLNHEEITNTNKKQLSSEYSSFKLFSEENCYCSKKDIEFIKPEIKSDYIKEKGRINLSRLNELIRTRKHFGVKPNKNDHVIVLNP